MDQVTVMQLVLGFYGLGTLSIVIMAIILNITGKGNK